MPAGRLGDGGGFGFLSDPGRNATGGGFQLLDDARGKECGDLIGVDGEGGRFAFRRWLEDSPGYRGKIFPGTYLNAFDTTAEQPKCSPETA